MEIFAKRRPLPDGQSWLFRSVKPIREHEQTIFGSNTAFDLGLRDGGSIKAIRHLSKSDGRGHSLDELQAYK